MSLWGAFVAMSIAVQCDQTTVNSPTPNSARFAVIVANWMLREAFLQFVEREEKREAFRQAGLPAWKEYQTLVRQITHDKADACLAKLDAGVEAAVPECQT